MLEAASLGAGVGGAVTVAVPVPTVSGEDVETICPFTGSGVATGVGAPDPVPCPGCAAESRDGKILKERLGWK